jgi:hypothetical protein
LAHDPLTQLEAYSWDSRKVCTKHSSTSGNWYVLPPEVDFESSASFQCPDAHCPIVSKETSTRSELSTDGNLDHISLSTAMSAAAVGAVLDRW